MTDWLNLPILFEHGMIPALIAMGTPAIPYCLTVFDEPDYYSPAVKQNVLYSLGRIGGPAVVQALVERLRQDAPLGDEHSNYSYFILPFQLMDAQDAAIAAPEIAAGLFSPKAFDRRLCAQTLLLLGHHAQEVLPILVEYLASKDRQMASFQEDDNSRAVVAQVLGSLGRVARYDLLMLRKIYNADLVAGHLPVLRTRPVTVLGEALEDPDPLVRVRAAEALGRIGFAESAEAISRMAMLLDREAVKAASYPLHCDYEWDESEELNYVIWYHTSALQSDMTGPDNIIQFRMPALELVLDSLGMIGPAAASAKDKIRPFTEHRHPGIRHAARDALRRIGTP